MRNTVPAMANHLRPPDRHLARLLGALGLAIGVAVVVLAAMSGRPPDDTTELVQPVTDVSTDPTVLGSTVERSTTLPSAPPADAFGFTTTTGDDSSDDGDGGGDGGPAPTTQATTSPTIAPPVSITRPPTRSTTTTTAPTTTTTAPTTTTSSTTTPTTP